MLLTVFKKITKQKAERVPEFYNLCLYFRTCVLGNQEYSSEHKLMLPLVYLFISSRGLGDDEFVKTLVNTVA
jgi:hypothetical protein